LARSPFGSVDRAPHLRRRGKAKAPSEDRSDPLSLSLDDWEEPAGRIDETDEKEPADLEWSRPRCRLRL
jgi:hypothetical protein